MTLTVNANAIQSAAEASSVYTVSSYITVNSVNEMIQKSSTIVIGKVTKIADHRNLARMVTDTSKSDPGLTIVGTVYEIAPETYLKGRLEEPLLVVQSEGALSYASQLR